MRLSCPYTCPHVGQTRCAPQKCEFFTVSGSSGVLVDIHNAVPVTTSEDPAMTRWSLSEPMDVLVKMTSPSPAIDEDKVRPRVGGANSTRGL